LITAWLPVSMRRYIRSFTTHQTITMSLLPHRSVSKRWPLAIAALALAIVQLRAEDIYLAQTQQGTGSGANAANAKAIGFFNIASNWSSPTKVASKIGPGDVVHLTGTITTALIFQKGGTAPSGPGTGPITLFFEPGAVMTSPAWPNSNNATGAITVPHQLNIGLGYVIVDGGTNGLIENTDNGTNLDNQVDSIGVAFMGTHNSIVRNLTVANLYIRPGPNGDGNVCGVGVKIFAYAETQPAHDDLVTNCVFHDEFEGLYILYGAGWTNMEYSYCTAYNVNWGGNAGDGSSVATLSGLKVHNNNFHDFTNWDDNSGLNRLHHNAFFGWTASGGTLQNISYYNNIFGPNFGVHATSCIYDSGDVSGITIFNNLFLENGPTDAPDDGLIYLLPNSGSIGVGYKVYNNTFIGGGSGTAIDFSGGLGPSKTVFEAKNNVAQNLGTFLAVYYNASSTLVSDCNVLYNIKSTMLSSSTTNSAHFDTLSQWQAMGYDLHSTILSPNLSSSYVPKSPSSAIGVGINLSSYFSTDINGSSRPAVGPWDLGALVHSGLLAPAITSATSASGTDGSPFNYIISASNSPTSYQASSLPSGLSVNTSTGVISGTPSVTGTFNVTISASNSVGTGSSILAISIASAVAGPSAPVISSVLTASATVGQAFTYTIVASGSPTSYAASGLPGGLSLNPATGSVTGSPTSAGTYSATISATNAAGAGSATLSITVSPSAPAVIAPVISGVMTVTTFTGQSFSYTISALGAPTSYSASGLPSGLSINTASGLISGVPTKSGTYSVTLGATNSAGTGTATLSLTIASSITSSAAPTLSGPFTVTATVNQAFSFTVSASGSPTGFTAYPLPSGLTFYGSTGLITGTPRNLGQTSVALTATNSTGVGKATLTITVVAASVPVITSASKASATAGVPFSYTIAASNSPTSFQASGLPTGLKLNSATGIISGTFASAVPSTVSVQVGATNAAGAASQLITITISSSGTNPNGAIVSSTPTAGPVSLSSSLTARLTNLSTRAVAGPGANSLITGFVVSGGPMPVLARGIGPGLQLFGVSGFLPDPTLSLFQGSTLLDSNSAWGGDPTLSAAFSLVSAFPLDSGSLDDAVLDTLNPGTYTVQLSSAGDSSGVALAELYDADPGMSTSAARLINLSSRANVGTGANILIVGFTVGGTGTETVVIRAVGPTLASFGVSGYLASPVLTIYDEHQNLVATNAGWGGDPTLANAFSEVGAFALPPDSNDSALLLTLAPGSYSAQISGADGGTGIALAEIYEVP
jgi:hypothetical protein